MVLGHMFVEVEGVKQSVLLAAALSHRAGALPSMLPQIYDLNIGTLFNSFSTE